MADAAVTVVATTVKVGATVVGTAVDVTAAGATRVRQTNPHVIDYMQFTHAKLALQRVGGGRRQAYRREEFLLLRCHGR